MANPTSPTVFSTLNSSPEGSHPATGHVTFAPTESASGVSSVPTTLSSAASTPVHAEPKTGFSAQLSEWINQVIDAIRSFLAQLPFIGKLFEKVNAADTPTCHSTSARSTSGTDVFTDAEIINMIKGQFFSSDVITTVVPQADVVEYCLNLFRQIGTPIAKLEVFRAVIQANNSTDSIAQAFYQALPEELQTNLRRHIWIANGHSSTVGGVEHGLYFGQYIINTVPRGALVRQAVENMLAAQQERAVTSNPSTLGTASNVSSSNPEGSATAGGTNGGVSGGEDSSNGNSTLEGITHSFPLSSQ